MEKQLSKGERTMVRKSVVGLALLCLLVAGSGYAADLSFPTMSPVPPPTPGHDLKVDNLLVIADVSRSMTDLHKAETERALLTSFNQGLPRDLKNAGMRTFGKSAYYHTILVQPVGRFDRAALREHIDDLKGEVGNTPLTSALNKMVFDLKEKTGNIAVVVVSDGENPLGDPVSTALKLGKKYGNRLCIYTIHVGSDPAGRELMKSIAKQVECGKAVTATELTSSNAMTKFIADAFYELKYLDSDGDGVPDHLDKCPNTPKGVKVDRVGCPLDSDGDGVPDYLDKCPDTPKGVKVDKVGCPLDSDGDGVPDYLDKCPNTPKGVHVDVTGCWVIKDLKFEYNKWDIKPQYYPGLNNAVHVLNVNPTMKVEIHGHTDSIGSDAFNKTLSEKRAQAVKNYLISKGIDANRLTVKGMGKQDPIASNETPEGRAQNRRVEFNVISL
jgi:OOP family OmpA-OmpF porin